MAKKWRMVRLQVETAEALQRIAGLLAEQGFLSDAMCNNRYRIAVSTDDTVRELIRRDEAHRIRARRRQARPVPPEAPLPPEGTAPPV